MSISTDSGNSIGATMPYQKICKSYKTDKTPVSRNLPWFYPGSSSEVSLLKQYWRYHALPEDLQKL
ncbi:hypothetical protein [Laspinema olomoucense]|uniref:Uncharacterized protein n=1 Tax=Laspinema olomoucense D3b TaxID=2953688 RepID=A0ABT2N3R4_9CYAN|nr:MULTISPECIES: hypothetical protein [unclassified Laspinema]MCT7971937.1 hypothetical protein [Laspinema sp. D3d]MCT7976410.1 hypothetical protein [Laspinema sp. D3b]MCT7991595.1 hypothetical protein [Laspinema sp. D3a]